jgi:flagellar hook-length control protein FliK
LNTTLTLTALLSGPGAVPGPAATAAAVAAPAGPEPAGTASPFAILAALAAGTPVLAAATQAVEGAKGPSAGPVQACAPGATPTDLVADDLALVLAQAANPDTVGNASPDQAASGGLPGEAASDDDKVTCRNDPETLDAAAAPEPAADQSLAISAALLPAPAISAQSGPAEASGAGEHASAVGSAALPVDSSKPRQDPLAPPSDLAPTPHGKAAQAVLAQDQASRSGPAWAGVPDSENKAAPGAASIPVRQDGEPHELPPAASDVARARAFGANGLGKGSEVDLGLRNGAESADGRPAEPASPGRTDNSPGTPSFVEAAPEGKAAPAHDGQTDVTARADKPATRQIDGAEAAKPSSSDLLPAPVPNHSAPHIVRAAEAAPAPPAALPPAQADAVPMVPNVPLAAVPVEIGLRSLAGLSRFEIRLEPEDLGRIDVRLDIDGDTVQARLTVDRVETLALLQRDAKTLERAFEQAGLKPSEGGIDLSLRDPQGDARGHHRGDDRPGRDSPDRRPPPREPDADAPPRIVRTLWRTERRLDMRI